MSLQTNRLSELLNENSEFIVKVDANVNKTDGDTDLVLSTAIPISYAYDYIDRLKQILEYSDVYDRITLKGNLTAVNASKFSVLPPIPQVAYLDLDSDGFPDIYETIRGTDPYDVSDFPVSFFNIFRYL
jgi:hypothetical protein